MKNFSYARADDQQAALNLFSQSAHTKFLGGGTNLIDLMRENIEQPDALVDITRLPLTAIEELPDGGFASEPWLATVTWLAINLCVNGIRCSRKPS